MNTFTKLLTLLVITAVLGLGTTVNAAAWVWAGTSDTNWNNAANWTPSGVDTHTNGTFSDRLEITSVATYACSYTAAQGHTIYTGNGATAPLACAAANGATANGNVIIAGGIWESQPQTGQFDYIAGGGAAGAYATGVLTIAGGTYVNTNAASSGTLMMERAGTNSAILNVNSGTALVNLIGWSYNNGGYNAGSAAVTTNAINLNGGVLGVINIGPNVQYNWPLTINFNGGTLQAIGNAGSFAGFTNGVGYTMNAAAVNVLAGGAVLDSQGFTATTPNGLLHGISGMDGGLTKQGGGSWTISGTNTYNGPTLLQAGTLNILATNTGGGAFTNFSGTTLGVTVTAAGQTLFMSSLTESNLCTNTFNLGALGNPTQPVIYATNLLVPGTNQINITGSGFSVGQFPLIKYTSQSGLTAGSFVAGSLPFIGFISNNVANSSVDVVINGVGIPAGALSDSRLGLGYLVVTYYPGVTNNGTGDCQPGIQAALNDAFAANYTFQTAHTNKPLAVFFPPGVYQISNLLTSYQWSNETNMHYGFNVVMGSTEGGIRPRIKLAAGAPNYQIPATPWPMISFRCFFNATNPSPVPVPNPMSSPTNYPDDTPAVFWSELRNLDFDCNGNPGAVGVVIPGAQGCGIENVRVWATNALAGFYELPGAGACSANLEVDGGQYGIIDGYYSSLGLQIAGGTAGPTLVGVTLANQTVAALLLADELGSVTVAGFNITNCTGVAVKNQGYWESTGGTLTLLDGQIAMGGGGNPVAITNVGRGFYVRNVYVGGTTNLIASSGTTTVGAGSWSKIAEYSYNNPTNVPGVPPNTGYVTNANILESYAVVNGAISPNTLAFPTSPTVVNNSGAPSMNLVSRHLWVNFPSYNGATNDPPTVVVSTNAGWNNTNDATALLQAAIDSASTSNAQVFLPGGIYYVTNTVRLHPNTVLLGVGRQLTKIMASAAWMPTTGTVSVMQSDNSATATTTLAFLTLETRPIKSIAETNYSRFGALTWQAGGDSLVLGVDPFDPWTAYTNCQVRSMVLFTNNGGGHWYGETPSMPGDDVGQNCGEANPGFRLVRIMGTTQPLWVYGFSIDYGNSVNDERGELTGASNVRLLGLKQESPYPIVVMNNCTNIAAYGLGDSQFYIPTGNGFFQVLGNSTNILLANLTVLRPDQPPQLYGNMLYEAITGQPVVTVLWPNNVSLYKRGNINDALMLTVPGIALTTVGNQSTISWVGGGTLQSANQVTGPYLPVAGATSPYTINTVANGSQFFRVVK